MFAMMSANTISGGCLCGAIRYEAAGIPYNLTHCHCEDCRRSSGAAFVTWASFRRSEFRFTIGTPRGIRWASRQRLFCPTCGTPLMFIGAENIEEVDEVDITVCTFDHPEVVKPSDHTWISDRLSWIQRADGLPGYAKARESA